MFSSTKTNAIKIAIVEDHTLVRETFKNYINQSPFFSVVLDVTDGDILFKELKKKFIDINVLLLDLFSYKLDGRETLKMLSELYPSIRVIILSASTDQKVINTIFDLGAFGFVSKTSDTEELNEAIHSAAEGKIYQNKFYFAYQKIELNVTEIRILQLLWQEKTSEEMSSTMCLSISTIEKIKHQLKEKTNTKTTIGLIKYALEKRILIPGLD
ncbi:hypothetical protein DC498_24105 [Terrimonas sp.]|uniref:response regulator transcription factor n=1 Tax=Terrimonas sp. TaxID=1914338 RepID=UPI000D51178A|nr:response regulator transcription factor [Terrimonas sp.]PVD49619.1 hypothetical protein DC498_24105 [Terrimonas sp.]